MDTFAEEQGVLFPVMEAKLRVQSPARRFLEFSREHGGLVPQQMVADSLGISHQRVSQFIESGRLIAVEVGGRRYVSGASLELFLTEERKAGRPVGYSPVFARRK